MNEYRPYMFATFAKPGPRAAMIKCIVDKIGPNVDHTLVHQVWTAYEGLSDEMKQQPAHKIAAHIIPSFMPAEPRGPNMNMGLVYSIFIIVYYIMYLWMSGSFASAEPMSQEEFREFMEEEFDIPALPSVEPSSEDQALAEVLADVKEDAEQQGEEDAEQQGEEKNDSFRQVVRMLTRERNKGMETSVKDLWSIPPKMYDLANPEDHELFHQKKLTEYNTAMQQYIHTNTPSNVRQLFLVAVVGDTLKTNPTFLAEYRKGKVDKRMIKIEMATVAQNTGASEAEQNAATDALFRRLQNNPGDWTGSRDLMGTVDDLDTFLDTVALMAENQLAMKADPDDVFVETQSALWLSTKAGNILEKIRIDGEGGEEMARILRQNPAGESSRELLLSFLERMNPRFEIPAISRLYASISNRRGDKLATLLITAAGLRKTFQDSRQDILNQFETAVSNNNWDQTRAWLIKQYKNSLLEYSFTIVSTVAIGTTAVAAGALWTLYKVTLGRFGTKSKADVDDVTAGGERPDHNGEFYTKRDGGGLKWAQKIGKNGTLRKCIRQGDRWAKGIQLIRKDDPDYQNWKPAA